MSGIHYSLINCFKGSNWKKQLSLLHIEHWLACFCMHLCGLASQGFHIYEGLEMLYILCPELL